MKYGGIYQASHTFRLAVSGPKIWYSKVVQGGETDSQTRTRYAEKYFITVARPAMRACYDSCQDCGATGRLHVHHKDKDRLNNRISNLRVLCPDCHWDQHPEHSFRLFY